MKTESVENNYLNVDSANSIVEVKETQTNFDFFYFDFMRLQKC